MSHGSGTEDTDLKEVAVMSPIELITLLAAIALVGGATVWLVRQMMRDGYGMRPAPRGTEEWSALGLPSRPYGS